MKRDKKGFSLLELLFVVAIVAILGSLAYPSYIESVQDGRRSEAQQNMLQVAVLLERMYSRNGGYPDSDQFTGLPTLSTYTFEYTHQQKPTGGGNFTSRAFELKATPKEGSAQHSDRCGVLTLNHVGTQGAEANDCW
ncbi:type IV pilin protein [Pseudoalteromonas sp. T1lg65]|uniref:type IV pilin protein n=1 Tax=Pseudoalteromonas sp. T1lg65 TaxID=2077101 RepID=UPI003F797C56